MQIDIVFWLLVFSALFKSNSISFLNLLPRAMGSTAFSYKYSIALCEMFVTFYTGLVKSKCRKRYLRELIRL